MKSLNRLLSFLRRKWSELAQIDMAPHEPGFIGPAPYLLWLRWAILLGIGMRTALHHKDYDTMQKLLPVVCLIAIAFGLALVASYATTHPNLRGAKRLQGSFIVLDILVISLVYYLTYNPESDFFLFYYLPIFAATEYFGLRAALLTSVGVVAVFGVALFQMEAYFVAPTTGFFVLNVFFPRTVFFVGIVMASSILVDLYRRQHLRAARREEEIETLLKFKADVGQVYDVHKLLELTVNRAVSSVKANAGEICLIDYKTHQLEYRSSVQEDARDKRSGHMVGNHLIGQALQQDQAARLNEVQPDSHLAGIYSPDKKSTIRVPIMSHGGVVGELGVQGTNTLRLDTDSQRLLRGLADQVASAIERAWLLAALHEIGSASANILELDFELDCILEELTEKLGFEYAAISLVDDYRGTIEMIRGKHVPRGWETRSKYGLEHPDIVPDVVRSRRTEVIEGWDDRFNREIYERFGHASLARIFVPLIADGVAIGTIEAGGPKERRAEILTPAKIQKVEELGRDKGKIIAQALPYVLLELIASHAIRIIGADSASLHVYRFDETLLEAGAGKATREFLQKFSPRKDGIGRRAMRSDEPVIVDNPQDLKEIHPSLYSEGVRSIAAFPLFHAASALRGVLYVHFWREHPFSEPEKELGKMFAQQMEIVVQNQVVLRLISENVQRVWTLSGLQNVVQSLALASSLDLPKVLEDVAWNVLRMLDADNVTLYQFFQESARFESPPVMAGSFKEKNTMYTPIDPASTVWKIVRDGQSRFMSDVSHDPMLASNRNDSADRPRFIDREKIKSAAALLLRVGPANEIVGLMFVNYRTPHDFSVEDQKAGNTLASSAAVAIKTARLHEQVNRDLKRRDQALAALRAVDQAIVVGPREQQQILEFILEKGMEVVGAPTGAIKWWNQRENILESKAQRGFPENQQMFKQRLEEGIVGLAARERRSILARDITANEWSGVYRLAVPGTRSELAVPLMDENGLLGVLNVEHPEPNAFNEDDQALLEMLAVEAIIAIHSTNLYQRLERQIKPLRVLNTIATRIQAPRSALDTTLRLLLTGVTAGDGLCFSRAMLFLADDEGAKLQGGIAIGAQTKKEAQDTWSRLDQEVNKARTSGRDTLLSLLDRAEAFSAAVAEKREQDCPLSIAIQEVCVPVKEDTGALSACVLKGKTIIVRDGQPDPFREIIERVTQSGDRGHAFACAPLTGKGRTIGALVVDNRFLMNEREIDEGIISSLEAFASVAAMSVENARLQARLEEEQKLAAWNEFTASVAHTIGTRVGVIENWATILHSSLQREGQAATSESLDNPQVVLEKLREGIYKAKVVLQEFRAFTAPLELRPEELNAGVILKNALGEVQPGLNIPIALTLPEESLTVKGDPTWLSVAFIELIKNANEAMQQSPVRPPQITITLATEEVSAGSGTFAKIEFIDTGPGVRETDKKRIFEPYFSTKGRGSGLGLANVKRIIEGHTGTIEEIGQYGAGAWFVVRLLTVRSNP